MRGSGGGTLRFVMCRNVPKRRVVSGVFWLVGVLSLSVLFGFVYRFCTEDEKREAPMLALPLRLPTATYGGHMGPFLCSVLILTNGLNTSRQ